MSDRIVQASPIVSLALHIPQKEGIRHMRQIARQIACAPIAAGLLSLCGGCGGGGQDTGSILSGRAIHEVVGGAVTLGPRDSPLANVTLSFHGVGNTRELARAETDGMGNYTLPLPAGTYGVDLADRQRQPTYTRVQPQQIVVLPRTTSQTDIKFVEEVP